MDLFFHTIYGLGGQPLVDTLMVFAARDLIYVIYIIAFVLALKGNPNNKKALIISLMGLGIALIFIDIIRSYYYAQRPFLVFPIETLIDHPLDASFPSKHTTIASLIAFSYGYYRSRISYLLLALAIWIGFARVYVGVHYPIDILGGVVIAGVSVYLAHHAKNVLREII